MRRLLALILSAAPVFGAVFNDGTRMKDDNSGALATAAGNLDDDDAAEFVSISSSGAAEHFEVHDFANGAWASHEIISSAEVAAKLDRFGTEIALADMDDDGDTDIAVVDSSDSGASGEMLWYENPGSLAGAWTEHSVTTWSGSGAGNLITHSEIAAGDINGDGMMDLVARDVSHGFYVLIQDAPGDGSTWETRKFVATNPREGIALADIDQDGDLDVVINGVYYETPADPVGGTYTQRTYAADWYPSGSSSAQINDYACQVRVADFDGDGDLDIAITNAEELSNDGTTATKPNGIRVYLCPSDPVNDAWVEEILHSSHFSWHSCEIGDFDKDGDVDVISGISLVGVDTASALIMLFKNDGDGSSFTQETIDSGSEGGTTVHIYQASVGDYDGDGDLDLLAPNDWSSGPIWIYENATPPILPDRIADWGDGNAGVRGGIPDTSGWPIHSTISAGASVATINAAIAAAPNDNVVMLSAGAYNLTAPIRVTRNRVVIRGAGTNTVIAPPHTSYGGAFHIGDSLIYQGQNGNFNGGSAVNWTAGYAHGTAVITLASTTGLTVGQILVLDQLNDPSFVNAVGYEGDNKAGRGGTAAGASVRALQQFVQVMAINGNDVTINPPVQFGFWNASFDPEAWWVGTSSNAWTSYVGIEDLLVDGENLNGFDPYSANIYYETAANCWIKGVTSLRSKISHVNWFGYYRCEVRESTFWGTKSGLSLSYGLLTVNGSWTLVEDNTFEKIVVPVMAGTCSSLGVVGYNFSRYHYYAGANNWQMPFFAAHDAHNYGFLIEGNHTARVVFDFIHGSSSHHTLFRNVLHGQDDQSYPDDQPALNNLQVVELQLTNRFISSVGNILGKNGLYGNQYDVPGARLSDPVIYDVGNVNTGYDVAVTNSWWADTNTVTTFFAHMDYDFASDSITYNATNSNRTLPDSLYLTSKPSFFGAMAWPPYSPTNTTTAQMSYTNIPAGLRFVSEASSGGGSDPVASVSLSGGITISGGVTIQ